MWVGVPGFDFASSHKRCCRCHHCKWTLDRNHVPHCAHGVCDSAERIKVKARKMRRETHCKMHSSAPRIYEPSASGVPLGQRNRQVRRAEGHILSRCNPVTADTNRGMTVCNMRTIHQHAHNPTTCAPFVLISMQPTLSHFDVNAADSTVRCVM